MVRDANVSGPFLHIKEVGTHGGPLSMIDYGIWILPLIRDLRDAHPQFTHSWYDYDAGAGRKFLALQSHLEDPMVCTPPPPPTHTGILHSSNQEHIGCLNEELPAGRGILPGVGATCGHRKPLLRRLHRQPGSVDGVD